MTGVIAPAGAGAEETNGSRYMRKWDRKRNMSRYLRPVSRSTWAGTEIERCERGADVPSCLDEIPLPSEFSEGLDHQRRGYVLAMRV